MSLVVVTLKSGKTITILKADAPEDAYKVKDDVERWLRQNVVISFATHDGLQDVHANEVLSVAVRKRDGSSESASRPSQRRSRSPGPRATS